MDSRVGDKVQVDRWDGWGIIRAIDADEQIAVVWEYDQCLVDPSEITLNISALEREIADWRAWAQQQIAEDVRMLPDGGTLNAVEAERAARVLALRRLLGEP